MKFRYGRFAAFFARRKRINRRPFEAARYRLKRNRRVIVGDILVSMLFLAGVGGTVLIIVYIYAHVLSLPFLKVREVAVRGCKELTEKEVLVLADIKPFRSMFAVGLEEVRRRVKQSPWVKEAYVGREFPDRIVIEIQERVPVAMVKRERAFFLVDKDGVTFKKVEAGDNTDLPILTTCGRHQGDMEGWVVERALALLRHLSISGAYPHIKNVAEVNFNERTGLSVFTDNGFCLQLGFDNYDNKLKRLPTVLADLERRNIKAAFLHIDLSDPAMITVQRRNITAPTEAEGAKAQFKT